jgi:DNA polymerase-3 subunit delta'
MTFEGIIGNNEIKKMLQNLIDSGNISHSYMFIGKSGIGKFLVAKEFSKAVLNNSKADISLENNPDFIVIEPQEGSIKIEQIRQMNSKILEKPIYLSKKIYIINDADLMTKEAQNALLKTLEEPPEYALIILIAENESNILTTIKSRCTKISFKKISNEDLKNYLKSTNKFEELTENLLNSFDGSIGKALNLEGKAEKYIKLEKVFSNLENMDIIDLLKLKEEYFNKEDIIEYLEYINTVFIEKVKNGDFSYINRIETLENTKQALGRNANYDMWVDNFLISMKGNE